MASPIKAGVVLVTKFVKPSSKVYSNYIDYIDRDEAVRNDHFEKYVDGRLYEQEIGDYLEYMGNPLKTSSLFTDSKDSLSKEETKKLKELFNAANDNGSLMWQSVYSFDNKWLEKYDLYNSETKELRQDKITEYVRRSMNEMLKSEKLTNAIWSGAIHFNTDNVHVHVATVEPVPMRKKIEKGAYKDEYKGRWKMSTITKGKSALANRIIEEKGYNREINQLFRDSMLRDIKDANIKDDPAFNKLFLQTFYNMPKDKRQWKYGNRVIADTRNGINEIVDYYIAKNHNLEFTQFKNLLKEQEALYTETYGDQKWRKSFYDNKMDDFYKRMGNVVIKQFKLFDYENSGVRMQSQKIKNLNNKGLDINKGKIIKRDLLSRRSIDYNVSSLFYYMSDEFETIKNLNYYESEKEYEEYLEKMRKEQEYER